MFDHWTMSDKFKSSLDKNDEMTREMCEMKDKIQNLRDKLDYEYSLKAQFKEKKKDLGVQDSSTNIWYVKPSTEDK